MDQNFCTMRNNESKKILTTEEINRSRQEVEKSQESLTGWPLCYVYTTHGPKCHDFCGPKNTENNEILKFLQSKSKTIGSPEQAEKTYSRKCPVIELF